MKKIITGWLALCMLVTTLTAQQNNTTVGTLSSINVVQERKIKEEDLQSKEISKELSVPKNGDIYIDNFSRGIIVKTWDQQKVKVTATVYYEGESKLTDEEWLEKINLSLKVLGSSVKIKSGSMGENGFYSYNTPSGSYRGSPFALFNAGDQNVGTKSNAKRIVTITVPAGSKLDIESKYAEVTLPANIGDLNIDISNGSLETENLGKLILRSKYSTVNLGDVKNAEIEFINGRFSARNIDELDIDTKYSTIELANTKKAEIRSTNDEYEFEEVGEIHGRKNYGNLRITRLNNSIDLEGANSDVKIRNIAASVSLIKIDDRYADIRIPLKNTKNYSVDFTGAYSSVYGNFEKKVTLSLKQIQTGTNSGALSSADIDERRPNITSMGSLSNLTVTGVLIDRNGNAVVRDTARKPNITTLGTLTAMTVAGNITPAAYANGRNNISAVTVPGTIVGGTVQGFSGTLTAGTFTPNITSTGNLTGSYNYGRGFSSAIGNDTPSKFTATVGDGKSLKIDMKCLNCTVDFK